MATSDELDLAFLAPKNIIRSAASRVRIDTTGVDDADLETFIRDILKILPPANSDSFVFAVEDALAKAGHITGAPPKPDPTKGGAHKLYMVATPITVGKLTEVIISQTWDPRPPF